jgi:hypothetical protein
MVSTSIDDGSSTISPSSDRGNTDANSSIGSFHTTIPPIVGTTVIFGGIRKKKEPTNPLPPQVQPLCALCEREGHPTNRCPTLSELRNLIQIPRATTFLATSPSTSSDTTTSSTIGSKGLRTKFACAICSEYGHYTHHCLALPQFFQMLAAVHQTSRPDPSLRNPLLVLMSLTFVMSLRQSLSR